MTLTCPCCGRAYPKPKAAPVVDVASLSDKEMFAYFKRTAPVENVRFLLRLGLAPEVRDAADALLEQLTDNAGKATADTNRAYLRLQEMWRVTAPAITTARIARARLNRKLARARARLARPSYRMAA